MWIELMRALALVMVIEGLMPLLAPDRWRLMLARVVSIDSRSLRLFGAALVGLGLITLQFLRS